MRHLIHVVINNVAILAQSTYIRLNKSLFDTPLVRCRCYYLLFQNASFQVYENLSFWFAKAGNYLLHHARICVKHYRDMVMAFLIVEEKIVTLIQILLKVLTLIERMTFFLKINIGIIHDQILLRFMTVLILYIHMLSHFCLPPFSQHYKMFIAKYLY